MTKYYRVRAQEQWNWLMKWFEEQDRNIRWYQTSELPTEFNYDDVDGDDIAVEEYEHEKLVYGDVDYYQNIEDVTDFIEVSQMMEDEKMEGYVTIKGEDLKNIEMFRGDESKGNLREFWDISKVNIPKSLLYPKVRMSVAEKAELDKLKNEMSAHIYDLDDLLTRIQDSEDYPLLYHRLYVADGDGVESQLEFARAWADESLIEVIPEDKYWVKCYPTDDCYFYKYEGKILAGVPRVHLERFQFTTDEIVEYHLDGTENIFEKVEVSE